MVDSRVTGNDFRIAMRQMANTILTRKNALARMKAANEIGLFKSRSIFLNGIDDKKKREALYTSAYFIMSRLLASFYSSPSIYALHSKSVYFKNMLMEKNQTPLYQVVTMQNVTVTLLNSGDALFAIPEIDLLDKDALLNNHLRGAVRFVGSANCGLGIKYQIIYLSFNGDCAYKREEFGRTVQLLQNIFLQNN